MASTDNINDLARAFYAGLTTIPTTGGSAPTAGAPTHTADVTVDDTAGGVTLLAANTNRKSVLIQNTGANPIRVSIGGTPTTTNGIQLSAGDSYERTAPYCPTGAIKAIREGASNSTAGVLEIV